MATPGIELRWGYGFDDRPRKREIFRPYIREGLELAIEGLDEMGFSIEDRKYLIVDQVTPDIKHKAEASGKTCHIFLTKGEIQRKRIDVVWLASAIFHELVHLVHNDYVETEGLLYHAAGEGIAYTAEYYFVNELLARSGRLGPQKRVVERVKSMPKSETNKLEAEFWKASAKPYTYDNFTEWFNKPTNLRICKGEVVGVSAVARQLRNGAEIAELIHLPPHEVLDVA
ncbi:MAG TPA: hypothetical protein VLG25_02645 [Patescibacteria group bacterium]|nr:hypothetical protein [Patescibacteria group bacterium]